MPKKIAYRTATLERPVPVPREAAWAALTGLVVEAPDPPGTVRTALSVEPPWRRVDRMDGGHPSPLLQTTVTIRDDGETCLVAWSCLVDPTGVDPDALDALVDEATAGGQALLDRLDAATAG